MRNKRGKLELPQFTDESSWATAQGGGTQAEPGSLPSGEDGARGPGRPNG